MRCPDENDGEVKGESEVPEGSLNLISTNYPDHGHHGHMVEPGIEPGTSWLVVRNSGHQATGLDLHNSTAFY